MSIKAVSLPSPPDDPADRQSKHAWLIAALLLLILGAGLAVSLLQERPYAPANDVTTAEQAPASAQTPFGALVHVAEAPPAETKPATAAPRVARSPLLEIDPAVNGGIAPSDAADETDLADALSGQTQEQAQDRQVRADAADDSLPLPPRRPQFAGDPVEGPTRSAARKRQRDLAAAQPQVAPGMDNRGIIERFFNINPPSGPVMAYARPDDGGLARDAVREANRMPMGASDGYTAVYDISARTVIMPNGDKLEAHSGLGELLDDPARVHVKNKGPTPPNVYELSPRESLFHGVPALRMTPVGGANMYGRDGFLAHTYMLGPNGDSNGCVSFKDYDRFLQAYRTGQVKRLIVVANRG